MSNIGRLLNSADAMDFQVQGNQVLYKTFVLKGNGMLCHSPYLVTIENQGDHPATLVYKYNQAGELLWQQKFPQTINTTMSEKGEYLGFSDGMNLCILNVATSEITKYPNTTIFTLDDSGKPAYYLSKYKKVYYKNNSYECSDTPVALQIFQNEPLVCTKSSLKLGTMSLKDNSSQAFFDMKVERNTINLVEKNETDLILWQSLDGQVFNRIEERSVRNSPRMHEPIYAPLVNAGDVYPIGNSYGEYQDYSGGTGGYYLHPGVDFLGTPNQSVHAVRDGYVKAILTTGGDLYWRVGIANEDNTDLTEGYLYAHLNESSISVNVGDYVIQGQEIGTLVPWPSWDFTHCHFARISCTGQVWDGNWLTTDNPLVDFANVPDTTAPVFENAYINSIFAYRNNSNVYLNPGLLSGSLDIISKCHDLCNSQWRIDVFDLKYSLRPSEEADFVLLDKFSYAYDMVTDVYTNSFISTMMSDIIYSSDGTCFTQGDHDYRNYYHVISHTDGDSLIESEDGNEHFNTLDYPNGEYILKVTARDGAWNEQSAEQIIFISNPNPVNHNPFIYLPGTNYDLPADSTVTVDLYQAVFDETPDQLLTYEIVDHNGAFVWELSNGILAVSFNGTLLLDSLTITVSDPELLSSSVVLYFNNTIANNDVSVSGCATKIVNYPNPFNPSTTISFDLEKDSPVVLEIFNIKGQKVNNLIQEQMLQGHHEMTWNGQNSKGKLVGSGIYWARLKAGEKTYYRKMLMLK